MSRSKTRSLEQAKINMDKRVQELRDALSRGASAGKRLPQLRDELQATQRYLRTNCTCEAAHYDEDERTPEDLEREIESLERDIKDADLAKYELGQVASFYRAYHLVAYGPKLRDLKSRLNAAEYWAEQWQSNMWAIELDTEKDIDECGHEKAHCEYEFIKVSEEICQLRAKIKEIQNIKYM